MSKRKADCTVEEWQKFLEQCRERSKSPAGRARDKARYNEARKNNITGSARKRKYGITPQDFGWLLAAQDGACAVCLTPFTLEGKKRRFIHVDHCHSTMRVRGLLCAHCNVAEGYIRKLGLTPAAYAKRLQAYLDNPPASEVIW